MKFTIKTEEEKRNNRVMFYLTFPIVVLYIMVVLLVVVINPNDNLIGYLSALAIATIFIILAEARIFRTRIMSEFVKIEKMQRLLEEQDRSARLLIRRDLDLKRANDQLQELDQRKSEFLSVVAHQLRTPLSGIKWTMNMLLSGDFGELNKDQKSFLVKSYESNQRMISLIEDMLGADRVGSGKLQYNFESIPAEGLFDSVYSDLLPFANKKNIQVKFHKQSDLPKVFVDAEKIRGVFQNLFENAIKYTKENGTIRISLDKKEGFVEVSIADDGIGIPQDQQKNIFNRFFRAGNAVKYVTDGSGLGLYIAKSIIEKHEGKIWFESKEGVGTTFYFTLKIG